MLVDRRDRGIGLVERGQRLLGGILTIGLLGDRARERSGELTDLSLGGGEFSSGLVDFAGDLQGAGLAAGPTVHPARAHQITVAGHRAQA